jgi:hypothetical protein
MGLLSAAPIPSSPAKRTERASGRPQSALSMTDCWTHLWSLDEDSESAPVVWKHGKRALSKRLVQSVAEKKRRDAVAISLMTAANAAWKFSCRCRETTTPQTLWSKQLIARFRPCSPGQATECPSRDVGGTRSVARHYCRSCSDTRGQTRRLIGMAGTSTTDSSSQLRHYADGMNLIRRAHVGNTHRN